MSDQCASNLFPDQVICEILIRLPAKSLCRFKCVSKRWFSLISSSHFITSYISHSIPAWAILDRAIRVEKGPKDLTLTLAEPPNVSSFSVSPHMVDEDLVNRSRREYPFLISDSSGLLLFAVSRKRDPYSPKEWKPNSFCHSTEQDSLLVCNPITCQWVELPKPPNLLNRRTAVGFATEGLGPGGVVASFVVAEYQPIIGSEYASMMTFSSETGKWEVKSANYMLGMHSLRPGGVLEIDGHLVWFDLSCGLIAWDEPFTSDKVVQCRFIPLPEGCITRFDTPRLNNERCIGVGGGSIQYLEIVNGEFVRLWRLEDYEGGEWVLMHRLFLKDILDDESYLAYGLPKVTPNVCVVHPFEADVAFFVAGNHIFSLNVGEKKVLSWGVYSGLIGWHFPFVLSSWPASFSPLLLASLAKDRGNEHLKEENFREAIDCYSRSIQHLPTAVAFANRAAAYLKIGAYLQAENDCTEALKLDDQYVKAYARRMMARKELGQLIEAKEDAEICLKLDPGLKEIQKLQAEVGSLLKMATTQESGENVLQEHAAGKKDD